MTRVGVSYLRIRLLREDGEGRDSSDWKMALLARAASQLEEGPTILTRRMPIRILCLGDIVGRPGRQVVHQKLPGLVKQHKVDLVVANAENIAGGSGITTNLFNKVRSYGVDVVTLGDHVFRKADIIQSMQGSERLVRP